MTSVDKPLTDAQEKALIRLAELDDRRAARFRARSDVAATGWDPTRRFCRTVTTAIVLERLGLVEMRPGFRLDWEARITPKGREMLASMGD